MLVDIRPVHKYKGMKTNTVHVYWSLAAKWYERAAVHTTASTSKISNLTNKSQRYTHTQTLTHAEANQQRVHFRLLYKLEHSTGSCYLVCPRPVLLKSNPNQTLRWYRLSSKGTGRKWTVKMLYRGMLSIAQITKPLQKKWNLFVLLHVGLTTY